MIKVYHFTNGDPRARTPIEVAFASEEDRPYISKLFRETAHGAPSNVDRYRLAAIVQNDDLDYAFERTNSIEQPWTHNSDVLPQGDNCLRQRSTSVGDVMVLGEVAYVVCGMGFERI